MNTPAWSLVTVMDRLRWRVTLLWGRMGLAELIAVALLLLWLGLQWQVVIPLAETRNQQAGELSLLDKQAAEAVALKQKISPESAGTQQDFVRRLPAVAQREQQLVALHELAKKQGVRLGRLDYRQEPAGHLPVLQQSVRLKIQGTYAAHRQFLHAVLAQFPNLAVDRIVLEGGGEASGGMGMSMDVTLYYHVMAGSGGAAS